MECRYQSYGALEGVAGLARIESAIGLEAARSSHLSRRFPSAGSRNPCRRERNFWMQRPEAQNPPERPFLSAETGNVENRRQDLRRNGLMTIDDGFRGSGKPTQSS